MAVADRNGLPISVCAESATPHEVTLAVSTLLQMVVSDAPQNLIGDNAYDSDYGTRATPERELVDPNEVVREMVVLLRSEAFRYSVAMRTELATELPKMTADRIQLQQVLMNLMLNGIEAMKEADGELTKNLTVKSQLRQDGSLLISVCDTTVGLPAEKAYQIFTPFFTTSLRAAAWAWRSAAP